MPPSAGRRGASQETLARICGVFFGFAAMLLVWGASHKISIRTLPLPDGRKEVAMSE
jgi:uncharacterized membrane protein